MDKANHYETQAIGYWILGILLIKSVGFTVFGWIVIFYGFVVAGMAIVRAVESRKREKK